MADSAVQRLRGILAASMTRTQIDALVDQVTAEVREQTEPIRYQLTSPALAEDDETGHAW